MFYLGSVRAHRVCAVGPAVQHFIGWVGTEVVYDLIVMSHPSVNWLQGWLLLWLSMLGCTFSMLLLPF